VSEVPLALAFGAGLVASVNPCGFALLPSLLAYYLGTRARGATGPARVADGLVVGLVLTAGFMGVFGTVGAVFALGGRAIVRAVPWATLAMGIGLVGLGLWLAAGRHVALRLPGIRRRPGTGYGSLLLFGGAYAVGSLSCTLPVFLLVVGSGLAAGSAVGTLAVFLAYALGMSTVLMVLCLGTAGLRELVSRKVRRLAPHLNRASGILLVVGGGYVVYYWSSLLRGADQGAPVRLVQDLQRWAQGAVLSLGDRWWLLLGAALLAAALVVLGLRVLRGGIGRAGGAGATVPTEDHEALEEEPV
jgi:cytochrome c biogenesis protein CcdA